MSDLGRNAREDKDVEWVSDSPGRTQEPLQSHTFSLKNNAAGLSSDEHENPLNGTQPNPFVYSGVPAVPHAGNSLPSGALVNGPGSHPTSEVHCVLNKGTVLSNNVLYAAWQAGKDTSPEVLPPPSELQSDAWKNTAGPVVKTLATQPGVNTPLSRSEENESKLACPTLSGAGGAEQMHISQPLTTQTTKTRSRRGAERSESSSDDYEEVGWDLARECLLRDDRRLETRVMHQGDRKHNTHAKSMSGSLEKVNSSLNHTYRSFGFRCDVGNIGVAKQDDSLCARADIKYSVVPLKALSRNTASESHHHINSTAEQGGCNGENDPENEDNCSTKVELSTTEHVERDPLFFSCTTCNVNFKEKRHFHRHMMYHLGKHNQVNSENVSQPFVCRECGRLFCDSNSLMRHIIIHRDRLEKLLEGIKDLKNTKLEDGGAAAPRPGCAPGCDCPKISVQRAKTHDNLKHYYFCEECNYVTLTQQALEAHLLGAHLNASGEMTRAEEAGHVQLRREARFFTSRDDDAVLAGRSELQRLRSIGSYKKGADRPEPNLHKSALGETAHFPHCSGEKGDFYVQKSYDKTVDSPQFKCRVGCFDNTMLPSLWRVDRHGKLLPQPTEKLVVATDLTCVEEDSANNDCKAFGSSKQTTCPATLDFLPSARNLKLDQMFRQGGQNDLASGSLQAQANPNSLSMRKISTPSHNTIDNMNGNISARFCQRLKKPSADKEMEKGCEGSSKCSDGPSGATGGFLESENARNPYARRYFTKRQRFSAEDQSPRVLKDEEDGGEDCSDIEQLIIKEEYVETTACGDSPESPCMSSGDSFDVFPTPGVEHKLCPYCPAVFESGVGLSNHVRGHLHRVGLSYNARHMVSPEQVVLRDHQPRIRRRIPSGTKKMRKAVKPETQGAHKCPLCWDWFDTKTGLSNHVRGHLKRIGGSVTSTGKSPLGVLNELLRDKKEHQNIPQVLDKSQFPSRISDDGLVLMHMGIPVKIQFEMRSPHPMLVDSFVPKQEAEAFSERGLQVEAQRGTEASTSTLVELLKMRRQSVELSARSNREAHATRKLCDVTKDYMEEPNWAHGECDSNAICIQCNGAFPGLPGHLRAYAHRKRIAIFEGPGDDYKPKKPRPGLKKKMLPSLDAEIYTLTCRFCDLVFQGPLSIQEDWIKHLQRHLLHTRVPHSGPGMVEVLGLHHMSASPE
ncbi:zinc finger protein 644 [Cyclopterus lumpus]|uniref:zinc finger protein 644 n=1 Tax=Cyclopterus lumpus TaxID=8103 RepID=UPI0014867523|nr:zinc finger protein 644 [Cyclopterus lumpus]